MLGNTVLGLLFLQWASHALQAANRLKIFTLLAQGGMSAAELGQRVGASSPRFTALLDACVAMGLLQRKDGAYVNSHLSDAHLVEGRPLYVGDLVNLQATEAPTWQRLCDVVTGRPEDAQPTPRPEVGYRQFTLAMNNLAMLGEAQTLAAAVDLSGCASMADVGCGSGIYSVELCLRYPGLRATLVDRSEVLETASEIVRAHGLEHRLETRPLDITTDEYGEDLDVVLLSDVLYQEKATCLAMLRSAHRALRNGGKLVVRGYYSDPGGSESLFGALFALNVLLGGPDREAITLGKLSSWIIEAGFRDLAAFALTGRSSCLRAVK